eukprot:m.114851 g.114851  ORF g.114851 m.114851 type:complete len:50 (-) comp9461_c0_seq7:210-359(-)
MRMAVGNLDEQRLRPLAEGTIRNAAGPDRDYVTVDEFAQVLSRNLAEFV